MNVEFLEIARIELNDAINWYDDLHQGLGYEFFKEVDKSIESILLFPLAWRLVGKHTRRCVINRFLFFCYIILIKKQYISLVLPTSIEIRITTKIV